jgi:hypothetical protein
VRTIGVCELREAKPYRQALVLRVSETDTSLTVVYRPKAIAIASGVVFAAGLALLLVGLAQPHEARLACAGDRCTLDRVGVFSSERVDVRGLRRAEVTPEELVLRATPDVVMGPWVAKRGVASYRRAAQTINEYLELGRPTLDVAVPVRGTLRWLGFGAVVIALGIASGVVFAIGGRTVFDRERDEIRRFGSRQRAKVSDVTAIEVRGKQIVATLRAGRPIAIVSAIGAPDLEAVAARIRRFVVS